LRADARPLQPKDSRLPDLEVPRGDLPLDFVQDPFGSAASKLYEAVLDGWPDGQVRRGGCRADSQAEEAANTRWCPRRRRRRAVGW
jgi:hypothetical protein